MEIGLKLLGLVFPEKYPKRERKFTYTLGKWGKAKGFDKREVRR